MTTPRTPSAFENLIRQLNRLPGIGQRSAERIAFFLAKQPPDTASEIADAIKRFKTDLKACSACGHITEADPCPICADPQRDHTRILVVEQPTDVVTIEQTGVHTGLYHVLMGRLAPLDGVGPGELNLQSLLQRLEHGRVQEVILGTNPTLEGDGTAMYLSEMLAEKGVKITRLARGLPAGASLETLSKAVLSDAIQGRTNQPPQH